MTKIATPNYSTAQEAIIIAAVSANDGVANKTVCEALADNPAMDASDGPRNVRSIIAKVRRMVETNGWTYERQAPMTKDGKPVTKKADLVATIAKASGITASKLDGLDKAPKLALESIAAAFAA